MSYADQKSKKKLSKKEYYKSKGASKSNGSVGGSDYTPDELVTVMKETKSWWPELKKRFPKEFKSSMESTAAYNTEMTVDFIDGYLLGAFDPRDPPDSKNRFKDKAKVQVIGTDSIDCAQKMYSYGYHPLVLNMASSWKPGGGVRTGATAQEEEIMRRSTALMCLEQPNVKREYPLKGCIYSPDVLVFRDNRKNGYGLYAWSDVISLSFIAVAAIKEPKLIKIKQSVHGSDQRGALSAAHGDEYTLSKEDESKMREKIELIFKMGFAKGHDCLVLSAFGCGAYKNPPRHVARIFKEVMVNYQYSFRSIVFAILSDKNDTNGNLKAFQDVFAIDSKNTPNPDVQSTSTSDKPLPVTSNPTKDLSNISTPKTLQKDSKSSSTGNQATHQPVVDVAETIKMIAPRGQGRQVVTIPRGFVIPPTPEIFKTYSTHFPALFCSTDIKDPFRSECTNDSKKSTVTETATTSSETTTTTAATMTATSTVPAVDGKVNVLPVK